MKQNFRFKLFATLIIFTFVITTTISIVNYMKLKKHVILNNQLQVEQAIDTVKRALKSLDKAYFLLDYDTTSKMEHNMAILQNAYERNNNLKTWDFDELATHLGMDIYTIDSENTITYSNIPTEIGLDFNTCCHSFATILDERRQSDELFIDGLDIEQHTGEIKKFSYMATPDKKYIFELGYNLDDEKIFEKYSFLTISDELVNDTASIEGINVLNYGGLVYGKENGKLTGVRYDTFRRVRDTEEIVQIEDDYNGEKVNIRYEPIIMEYDSGSTKLKVLEIIYNEHELNRILRDNQRHFLIQLTIVFVVTTILSILISSWFARPMYLAFHDSLTGLKNRAAFDEDLQKILDESKASIALLMLDLDNFKLINDHLGHERGDQMLCSIAQTITTTIGDEYSCYRLGGDEFVIIMSNCTVENAEQMAKKVIHAIKTLIHSKEEINRLFVSVSVGVALSSEEEDPSELLKNADSALYHSKQKGKNQYQFYK